MHAGRLGAHSDSIVSAFRSHRGCHASLHYLLSPPVKAVCFYGDGPCCPLEDRGIRGKEQSGSREHEMMDRLQGRRWGKEEWGMRAGNRKIPTFPQGRSSCRPGGQRPKAAKKHHLLWKKHPISFQSIIICRSISLIIVINLNMESICPFAVWHPLYSMGGYIDIDRSVWG